jgi:hypothetical protein
MVCLSRFYSTQEAFEQLPPPNRSCSFHCAECSCGIDADSAIYMRAGRSYCSERCRAIAPETDACKEKLFHLEGQVRRRL